MSTNSIFEGLFRREKKKSKFINEALAKALDSISILFSILKKLFQTVWHLSIISKVKSQRLK